MDFRILICFAVLQHHRRTVVHFNVTNHPTQRWTAQHIVEAFPYDTAPNYLLRDRDRIYGSYFENRARGMGVEELLIAPLSPWQSPFVERLIRSIRRECLDHLLVIDEDHLRHLLREYFAYCHESRPHQSLDGDAPRPREIEPPSQGKIAVEPQVGGLHHRTRRAARAPVRFESLDLPVREHSGITRTGVAAARSVDESGLPGALPSIGPSLASSHVCLLTETTRGSPDHSIPIRAGPRALPGAPI